LQGAIQSDGRSGPRHIHTIELGFIKWVGQLDEHRIDFLSRLNGCLRWGRRWGYRCFQAWSCCWRRAACHGYRSQNGG